MTTKALVDGLTTDKEDWATLNSVASLDPSEVVLGIQVNGYFPDSSTTNGNNGYDSQFVVRLPEEWNGKLVVTGAPGVRGQYSLDYLISDYVLSKGYAFASTDKGNTGASFYTGGQRPGDAVREWHRRVAQLTNATKAVVQQRYGKALKRTYITGISNGGYLTRYALENTPGLYDGGVDWEGTLFRAEGPNLFTYLPTALEDYPECRTSAPDFDNEACDRMIRAGFQPGSEFLWPEHYEEYWDITQRIYREEFDPGYDGEQEAGYAKCGELPESLRPSGCDADYVYKKRPQKVRDAVKPVSNTGKIGKPMITLHGTLDTLLPIKTDSNVYRGLVEKAGKGKTHRYYKIEAGNHVDSFYDRYPDKLRPILPCHRAAFDALEEWVEEGDKPPENRLVPKPENEDVANSCSLGRGATYSGPGG